ncbi:hypothetical protein MPNT_250020 [Candidatus Methylacidithermus pantelleriae]|uniref:Uncharacterized protein n=1 Tax=Candidatus Methylacidithermus pantelleriae TaxID=2744239 RepID=A0A8J2FSE1_9BACT|nr:hypothetical protein MPNT_250020 [Candidatus Methylacidithermus pantelleriae]
MPSAGIRLVYKTPWSNGGLNNPGIGSRGIFVVARLKITGLARQTICFLDPQAARPASRIPVACVTWVDVLHADMNCLLLCSGQKAQAFGIPNDAG